jgi:hypothetical protein
MKTKTVRKFTKKEKKAILKTVQKLTFSADDLNSFGMVADIVKNNRNEVNKMLGKPPIEGCIFQIEDVRAKPNYKERIRKGERLQLGTPYGSDIATQIGKNDTYTNDDTLERVAYNSIAMLRAIEKMVHKCSKIHHKESLLDQEERQMTM